MKTLHLLNKIYSVEFIVTDNEIEAFLLRSNLIKRYRPIFNINIKKSTKIYLFKNNRGKISTFMTYKRKNKDGNFFEVTQQYSPLHVEAENILLWIIEKIILRLESVINYPKTLVYNILSKTVMHHVSTVAINNQYMKNISLLQDILEGKSNTEKFIIELENKMEVASEHQQYEDAEGNS